MRLPNKRPLFATLMLLLSVLLPLSLPNGQASAAKENSGVLRLHVIANSDSEPDQAVKLAVRDALLAVMEPGASAAAARAFLLDNGKLMQNAAEKTLLEHGFSYGAQLMLGTYAFPDRSYAGKTYPAGDYEALRVVLGRGQGQNWWCVLFPPLCIVSEGAKETEGARETEDTDTLTFESSILNLWRKIS